MPFFRSPESTIRGIEMAQDLLISRDHSRQGKTLAQFPAGSVSPGENLCVLIAVTCQFVFNFSQFISQLQEKHTIKRQLHITHAQQA